MVENFMNKLAEKISAQDIIRANSQAEAKEAERIRQEAEQYKLQLDELRAATAEYKALLEAMRSDSAGYKQEFRQMRQDTKDFGKSIQEMRDDAKEYKELFEKNDSKIHDIGVQVYRNVQAIVEKGNEKNKEELKDLSAKLEAIQVTVETKNNTILPFTIITMILVLADLVFNILRFLGII